MRVLSIDIGIINLAFCIVDFNLEEHTFELIHSEKVCIGNMKDTCHKLSTSLIDFFDESEIVNEKPLDYVFIENQISRAIKNTILGYSAISYFYTKSLNCEHNMHVHFVSPRDKFKSIESYFPGILENYDINSQTAKSADLKKLSIQIATDLCNDLQIEKGLEALKNYKKKDDISDVLLQSFAFGVSKYRANSTRASGNPLRTKRRR